MATRGIDPRDRRQLVRGDDEDNDDNDDDDDRAVVVHEAMLRASAGRRGLV